MEIGGGGGLSVCMQLSPFLSVYTCRQQIHATTFYVNYNYILYTVRLNLKRTYTFSVRTT